MASLDTSANSQSPHTTSFSNPFMSFTNLLSSDHPTSAAARTGTGVPKFKSQPPPALPISPVFSPSSFFANIPPGLTPTQLLDSPIFLSSSNILPSPTTGTFPFQAFNWKSNSNSVNNEEQSFSDFSFQAQAKPMGEQTWGYDQEPAKPDCPLPDKADSKSEIAIIHTNDSSFQSEHKQLLPQTIRENKKSDDGYNWRKYGQKQVKGSKNPRSYYKCTYLNCPTKKIIETAIDGRVTEIVYKGSHNHPKPQSTRRSSSSSSASSALIQSYKSQFNEIPEQLSYGSNGVEKTDSSAATNENSSISVVDDDFEQSSKKRGNSGDGFGDEEESDVKRLKSEIESEGISEIGSRAVREPRVVVQTRSEIDILDDGYRWRKYGQKVVKGNPNPRSYYKCTSSECGVRKLVERACQDPGAVITTYEGKHNHDVPLARGSNRHMPNNPNNSAIRPLALPHNSNHPLMSMHSLNEAQVPYRLEMLQSPTGYSMSDYCLNSTQDNALFASRSTDEPRDDTFLDSLLC